MENKAVSMIAEETARSKVDHPKEASAKANIENEEEQGQIAVVEKEDMITSDEDASTPSTRSAESASRSGNPRDLKNTTGGKWESFTVEQWRDAAHGSKSFFAKLTADTTEFIFESIEKFVGPRTETCLVEVGCGTGEMLVPFHGALKHVIGTDINPRFVEYCQQNVAEANRSSVCHMLCDVTTMNEQLKSDKNVGHWVAGGKNVVICVGNTIGIMPQFIKDIAYQQMAQLAGAEGIAVMVFWNGNQFGNAIQHFYAPNKDLCGGVDGASINWEQRSMVTKTGYSTKWTTLEEALEIFAGYGMKVLDAKELGNGVLVAFRRGFSTTETTQ